MKSKLRPEPKTWGDIVADVVLDQCEYGYWLGETEILGLPFHVEVIEVKLDDDGNETTMNPRFEDRIQAWYDKNECERPQLLVAGKRQFFVHVEVYAS